MAKTQTESLYFDVCLLNSDLLVSDQKILLIVIFLSIVLIVMLIPK